MQTIRTVAGEAEYPLSMQSPKEGKTNSVAGPFHVSQPN